MRYAPFHRSKATSPTAFKWLDAGDSWFNADGFFPSTLEAIVSIN
jgi:hypothetical protein